ncbi:uncharacterized protein [Spinacia oleracea]|uniref:Uncharacterized protein n=1 Tax=Spinacia oleracea TaxID=3562 RepID=A0ABM3R5L1_SPIOL|nr:uncharacterized protein LOC130466225 [Spinacia oleracea]
MSMARFSVINKNLLLLRKCSRQTYASIASDGMKIQTTTSSTLKNKASEASEKIAENNNNNMPKKEQVYWMRDPRSGNWVPETHFDEVDVVELRHKLLFNKQG